MPPWTVTEESRFRDSRYRLRVWPFQVFAPENPRTQAVSRVGLQVVFWGQPTETGLTRPWGLTTSRALHTARVDPFCLVQFTATDASPSPQECPALRPHLYRVFSFSRFFWCLWQGQPVDFSWLVKQNRWPCSLEFTSLRISTHAAPPRASRDGIESAGQSVLQGALGGGRALTSVQTVM